MSKSKEKFPNVFLACPFDDNMSKLIDELNLFPWRVNAANKVITSDHLLKKIKADLEDCDIAIFDISDWNVNVCLELGLAESMGINYYILNNNTYKKEAPSDIKGIERIDYNWNKAKKAKPLYGQIKDGVFKTKYLTAKVWKSIAHLTHADKKFILALRIISSFKGLKKGLTAREIKTLTQKLNFKKQDDIDEVTQALVSLKLFKKVQKSGLLTPARKLYR
jgi:hypothetical protein